MMIEKDGRLYVAVEDLGSFAEVRLITGMKQSGLSMLFYRQREESETEREGDIPRPIARVSNGHIPIFDMAAMRRYVAQYL